ncbi:dTDP-4-dehydrorhamnose reductase [Rhodospirillum rubrum]|uniref:dTDP-4-dehydrorhamnose reductase n=1 Tax=Rhodospirillum rubrum TaxID=1085 RepID=UPI00190448D2|nr:dTDP-4-dehydrorhamnose reductase [Rhodospirillum rubrum]MBK1664094.1 dTDP-4-dehydrorhamnose reductase [Rhodospirillum rubrum]MBK1676067.1 dTDP-4-dehydrorhamnose reductase [Rhodospirillum rubrum]
MTDLGGSRPVLILGTGQVGSELVAAKWPSGLVPVVRDRKRIDLSNQGSVSAGVADQPWAFVINAAAYTAVDKAETDPEAAFAVNRDGPRWLAEACARAHIPLLHLSTDYVFDGQKQEPYRETDPVAPLGIYGASKEAGEAALRAVWERHIILRTAWVFSAHGHNFVKTMLRLGRERDELRVVADQYGCPTAASDIATSIIDIVRQLTDDKPRGGGQREGWGTYHFVGAGPTTWYGLADAVMAGLAKQEGRRPVVLPITTAQYPTPARRPVNSVLDCTQIEAVFGIRPRSWREGLDEVLQTLGTSGKRESR